MKILCSHRFSTDVKSVYLQTFKKGDVEIDATGVKITEIFAECKKCFVYYLIGYIHDK